MNNKLYGTTFYGNEASDYAKKNGYLDYATLAKSFDVVLNNNIIELTSNIGYWEQESGFIDNSEIIEQLEEQLEEIKDEQNEIVTEDANRNVDRYVKLQRDIEDLEDKIKELEDEEINNEIFQYYIISSNGASILEDWTNEIIFYNEELDMYVWGVTHYGTSWDYVLTDIKLNCGDEAFR